MQCRKIAGNFRSAIYWRDFLQCKLSTEFPSCARSKSGQRPRLRMEQAYQTASHMQRRPDECDSVIALDRCDPENRIRVRRTPFVIPPSRQARVELPGSTTNPIFSDR